MAYGHLDVEGGLDTLCDAVDSGPIAHDQSFPSPLLSKDVVEKPPVLRGVHTVDPTPSKGQIEER